MAISSLEKTFSVACKTCYENTFLELPFFIHLKSKEEEEKWWLVPDIKTIKLLVNCRKCGTYEIEKTAHYLEIKRLGLTQVNCLVPF